MSGKVVLMYHALWSDRDDLLTISQEERPYATKVDDFRSQMDWIAEHGMKSKIAVTFDDGHASAVRYALPILARLDMPATIFMATDWMSRRPGFCDRGDLQAVKDAGWQIGAHGHTHQFLTELTNEQLAYELQASSVRLSELMGTQPQMSFPGGRYTRREVEAAHEAGFVALYGSRPGVHREGRRAVAPRFALRSNTSMAEFSAIAKRSLTLRARYQAGYVSKQLLKRTLGDDNYHKLYKAVKS